MNQSSWPRIWVAFLAGCVAAFQLGKTFAALALMIDELGLSLVQAGLILSLFSLIAAFAGAGFGLLSDRIGHLRMALTGLAVSAGGAFLGAIAPDIEVLLLSRLIEGLGFILAIVALPSLISRSASDGPVGRLHAGGNRPVDDRHPSVDRLARLARPVERHRLHHPDMGCDPGPDFPWRPIQGRNSVEHDRIHRQRRAPRAAARSRRLRLLFTDYSVPFAQAARFGALVVVGNIIGNVSAGWLIGRGFAPWKLLTVSFVAMGLCAVLVFTSFSQPPIKIVAGFLFSAFGGMFPGTAFVLAARYSPSPSHMALMAGLMLQGAGIGQTIGPMMVSSVVEYSGRWDFANWVVVSMATIGLICALLLRKRT